MLWLDHLSIIQKKNFFSKLVTQQVDFFSARDETRSLDSTVKFE